MKLQALALASLTALIALPAFANPFKDSDGAIHIQNLTPGTSIPLESGEYSRRITPNFCGLLIVSNPPGGVAMPPSVNVGGTSVTIASLPTQTLPRCVDNVLAEARPADFKTADGRVVLVGRTPGVGVEVTYPGVPAIRNFRANGCGYIRVSNTPTAPAPATFSYGGTSYTTASLPTQIPSRCITINNTPVKFVPQP
jgi:hypothetical protein